MNKKTKSFQFAGHGVQAVLHAFITVPIAAGAVLGGSILVAFVVGFGVAGGDGARPGPAENAGQLTMIVLLLGLVTVGMVFGCRHFLNMRLSRDGNFTMSNWILAGEYAFLLITMVLAMAFGSWRQTTETKAAPAALTGPAWPAQRHAPVQGSPSPNSRATEHAKRMLDDALGEN